MWHPCVCLRVVVGGDQDWIHFISHSYYKRTGVELRYSNSSKLYIPRETDGLGRHDPLRLCQCMEELPAYTDSTAYDAKNEKKVTLLPHLF